MHWQARNPSRARDHRIALMPMARPAHEPPLIWPVAIIAVGFVVLALLVAGV